MGTTASTGAWTQQTGLKLKTTAEAEVVTWRRSHPMPQMSLFWVNWARETIVGFGSEAPTKGNRVFGTGQTAAHGSSHIGRRVNQAILKGKIAFVIAEQQEVQASQSGTIGNAIRNRSSCAPRSSAQVIYMLMILDQQIFPGPTTRWTGFDLLIISGVKF